MRTRMNGKDHISRAGDTLVIRRGIKHIAFNDKSEPLVCIVEYRPGLDLYKTLQCFAGLTVDGNYDKRGMVNAPRIMYMLRKAGAQSLTRPSFAPDWLFRLGMEAFYVLGSMLGWETLYRKYTN